MAFVEHKKFEIKLDGDYHVTIVTGDGPEDETEDFERLSTRFTLFYMDEEVARCHMSYRDGESQELDDRDLRTPSLTV